LLANRVIQLMHAKFYSRSHDAVIRVYDDAEQQGIAYAKPVAEAMDLKLDADNPADREKLRRAVLELVAGRKMRKQKGHG
jgi:hypothetical protein